MLKVVKNVVNKLKDNNSNNLSSELLLELSEHYELNNLTNISLIEIDGEEGVLVLDKALGYEIYFINSNSFELSKLYWGLDEKDVSAKYLEMCECCK